MSGIMASQEYASSPYRGGAGIENQMENYLDKDITTTKNRRVGIASEQEFEPLYGGHNQMGAIVSPDGQLPSLGNIGVH